MYELIILALLFTFFAVAQDLRTREVANWLNFSLIAFALAFRAFYALTNNAPTFFYFGIIGLAVFVALAYIFYYAKAFAGGDAKLLMGFGIILPYTSYQSILPLTLIFIFLLFFCGAIYSLIYSAFIAKQSKARFKTEFSKNAKKSFKTLTTTPIIFILAMLILNQFNYANKLTISALIILFIIVPWIWVYTKSLDKCMTKLYHPNKLTEGDWLERDVMHKRKLLVRKTVHGLSLKDIKLIRKHKIKVAIKEGIPFTPAFLLALVIMVFFSEVLSNYLQNLFYFLL